MASRAATAASTSTPHSRPSPRASSALRTWARPPNGSATSRPCQRNRTRPASSMRKILRPQVGVRPLRPAGHPDAPGQRPGPLRERRGLVGHQRQTLGAGGGPAAWSSPGAPLQRADPLQVAGATAVTIPTVGSTTSARRAISPGAFMPISTTSASVPGGGQQRERGAHQVVQVAAGGVRGVAGGDDRPAHLLRRRLPVVPVMATTRPPMVRRRWRPSRPSAASVSGTR
jgi:hypothetical protein